MRQKPLVVLDKRCFGAYHCAVAPTLHQVGIHYMHVQLASHHPPDDDDFGSQGSTDSEDGHETEAEDHKVDAEEDFTRVEQNTGQPEIEKLGDS